MFGMSASVNLPYILAKYVFCRFSLFINFPEESAAWPPTECDINHKCSS